MEESLHNSLRHSAWFVFDLDDTLHEFRKAASAAVTATLQLIIDQAGENHSNLSVSVSVLKTEYSSILRQKTSAAFVDGKTSHQYRAERFAIVMLNFNIKWTEEQMQNIQACYKVTLTLHLELKRGALELLATLKRQGKKIAVITEGPQDAQERTIAALGLLPYIDHLATTNKLGIAKVDGLFGKVLEVLELRTEDIVVVGDSWERDAVPAREAGIFCVHYAEEENFAVGAEGEIGMARVKTMKELEGSVESL
ncbi:HAD-like protein [Cucurbitaria berberidis CBS 394.84]|uniref:HAD-like protein n=1 Tax=Cucurbitaria berberidis CBS 394.84 TaxID=1168544 RepID=A0A9P4GCS9_9PLEO|nr:HAD-like protein [Cucurbitaria berberidis CBS 394.84]KAF1842874.1 HAD-like protein [Cucurbitaria berberidis CBS 394.84]